jgi:hypothetical protein
MRWKICEGAGANEHGIPSLLARDLDPDEGHPEVG